MDFILDKIKRIFDSLKKESPARLVEHAIVTLTVLVVLRKIFRTGLKKTIAGAILSTVQSVPGGKEFLKNKLDKEVDKTVEKMIPKFGDDILKIEELPKKGISYDQILSQMEKMKKFDINPNKGKAWAYVYTKGKKHEDFVTRAHNLFIHSNALNPMTYCSLLKMENDVVRMTAKLLGGDENVVGSLTTGGTESLLMAVKTFRDYARVHRPEIQFPEMVLPCTAHPAFHKAAHYFNVKVVIVPTNPVTQQVDLKEFEKKINKNTILLVGSAPQYPHGVIDPIEEIAKLGIKYNIPVHVDSCIGGFILPFLEKMGHKIPKYNFKVEGVTSISADIHKYGYSTKGSSVILYKNAEYRKFQYFSYSTWPGGLFVSPSMLGSRGGGPIAAAWASLLALGEEGFIKEVEEILKTRIYLQNEIEKIPGLKIVGTPHSSLLAFQSTNPKVNIFSVADIMQASGWKMECQPNPDSIHCTIMPQHSAVKEEFIKDLKAAFEEVKMNPEKYAKTSNAATYGMVASIPENAIVEEYLVAFMSKVYT